MGIDVLDCQFKSCLERGALPVDHPIGLAELWEESTEPQGRGIQKPPVNRRGFTIDENYEDNDAVINAKLEESDPLYSLKRRLLGGWTTREFQPQAQRNAKAKDLFTFLRTVAASRDELRSYPKFGQPQSVANETRALELLERFCRESLDKFEHSLQHDHKLLKINRFEDSNHRNCIIMRAGEKEVLMWYINLSRVGRKLLSLPYKDLGANAPKPQLRVYQYYKNVIEPLVRSASS